MEINEQVTLLFPWFAMERQISISGLVQKISESQSDEYFATRPWSSQIGAWASAQSQPLESREELANRFAGASQKWPEGSHVPRPPHWGGYRVLPLAIEFWQGRYSRLHDRLRYERQSTDSEFVLTRYYP
jgi:pyridoxamine 5'-phosphate oxidase